MVITDVLFPEILQHANDNLTLLFELPKIIEILRSYYDNFLKPTQKIFNPIYVNCFNSFLPNAFEFRELPFCISDLVN